MTTTNFGNNTGDDPGTDLDDASLFSLFPDTNYSTGAARDIPCLFRFDFSSIVGAYTVSAASFSVKTNTGNSSSGTDTLYKVKRAWVEAEATWNSWKSGSSWSTAGCFHTDDVESTASDTASYPGGYDTGYITTGGSSQMIADVQAIVDGGVNNGWKWITSPEGTPWSCISHDGTDGQRPYVTVTYAASGGGTNHHFLGLLGVA